MQGIRQAIANGTLGQPFKPSDVNRALGISYAGTFLPKHRVGNPDGNSQHFIQLGRGLCRLKGRLQNYIAGALKMRSKCALFSGLRLLFMVLGVTRCPACC